MSAGQNMDRRMDEPGGMGRTSTGHEEEYRNLVRRSLEEIWGKHSLTAIDQYYAPNFIDHTPAPGVPPNRDGIKQSVTTFDKAFSNSRLTVDDLLAQGDKVAARFTFHGKHTGDLQGVPPSGKDVTLIGLAICRLENGKIVESWEGIDQLQLMQQVGAVQLPKQTKR